MTAYPEDPHPGRELPADRRADYLLAVGKIVYADGHVDDAELELLRNLAEVLDLDAEATAGVLRAVRERDQARTQRILESFARDGIRYALLADAILVSYADGRLALGESAEIAELARALRIDLSQAVLMGRYVEEVLVGNPRGELTRTLAEHLADADAGSSPPRSR